MKIINASILALLAATALGLRAETPRYGVQGLVNLPLGDLKDYVDSKPGPGFGIHGTFDLMDGNMVRPRLDFSTFPQATIAGVRQTASSFSLGGDYLYFFAEKPEGLYFTTGLSVTHWTLENKVDADRTTSSTTKIGLAVGMGYQWNATLGTEARFLRSHVSSVFRADILQVGVTVRF